MFWCCLDLLDHLDADGRATIAVRDEETALAFEISGESRDASTDDLRVTFESIQERVEALSGRLSIDPRPAGAFGVAGRLPLSR